MLTHSQASLLERFGESLVPGSQAAGLARYLDRQLAADPNESLLIAKYFDIPPPLLGFYIGGLQVLQDLATKQFGKPLVELLPEQIHELNKTISRPGAVSGQYPMFVFYLCLRSDAVDVTYGTPAGFQSLHLGYREHILPPSKWDV